jgi:hypothetical protein
VMLVRLLKVDVASLHPPSRAYERPRTPSGG